MENVSEARSTLTALVKNTGSALSGALLGLLLGVLLILALLAGLTAAAVLSGRVSFICGAGLVWLFICYGAFTVFEGAKKTSDWFQAKIRDAHTLSVKIHDGDKDSFVGFILIVAEVLAALAGQFCFFSMGVVADIAKAAVNTHMRLVQNTVHAAALTSAPAISVPVFGRHLSVSALSFILFPLIGLFADTRRRTREHPKASGRTVMYFATFAFITGTCILVCGLWGADTFQAARSIFTASLGNTGPLSFYQQNAALVLYHVQGKYVFYALFGILPLWWFAAGLWQHRRGSRSVITLAGRTYMAAFWLLLLAGTLALRLHISDPRDIEFATCQTQFAGQPEMAGCYQTATAEWETELNKADRATLTRLNDPNKEAAFLKTDQQWREGEDKRLAALDKKLANRPDKALILAQDRLEATKARLAEVRSL